MHTWGAVVLLDARTGRCVCVLMFDALTRVWACGDSVRLRVWLRVVTRVGEVVGGWWAAGEAPPVEVVHDARPQLTSKGIGLTFARDRVAVVVHTRSSPRTRTRHSARTPH